MRPDRGTDHLVTDGPFSFTRNPLYLAGTMLVLGIGLVSGIVWFLLLAILPPLLCKSSLLSGKKGIYKRDSERSIWIMPGACGRGSNYPSDA